MRTFRQFFESARIISESTKRIDELRKAIRGSRLVGDIAREQTRGFMVNVDCQDSDQPGTYEVTDTQQTNLTRFITLFNRDHKEKIDWNMPDSKQKQVYIYYVK